MAKSPAKQAKPVNQAENETTENANVKTKAKKDDGFVEKEGGNRIYEEWRGEIKIETRGKKVVKRWFSPLVKLHARRKITEQEANSLNINAALSPRMDYVIMYLLPGEATSGEQINVDEIVEVPEQEGKE